MLESDAKESDEDETKQVQRGADHRGFEGAGGWHGDGGSVPRNLAAAGDEVDLFDWEPILVRPSHIPATEVVPAFASAPSRWLGGSDLLRLGMPRISPFELDQLGLRLLMQRDVK